MKIVNIAEKQSQKETKTTIKNHPYYCDKHGKEENGLWRLKAVFRERVSFPISWSVTVLPRLNWKSWT